ncbi:hypothetical protein RRG08_041886 [Elysia crispata]|uniref:Uncharacterized protein n=1 Tax=Elysia crispata TaxID=231223 RepID=A0AAE1CQF4_9GAST|nr:hypothetical protein RRG08_041886 [Elysia crispata]
MHCPKTGRNREHGESLQLATRPGLLCSVIFCSASRIKEEDDALTSTSLPRGAHTSGNRASSGFTAPPQSTRPRLAGGALRLQTVHARTQPEKKKILTLDRDPSFLRQTGVKFGLDYEDEDVVLEWRVSWHHRAAHACDLEALGLGCVRSGRGETVSTSGVEGHVIEGLTMHVKLDTDPGRTLLERKSPKSCPGGWEQDATISTSGYAGRPFNLSPFILAWAEDRND